MHETTASVLALLMLPAIPGQLVAATPSHDQVATPTVVAPGQTANDWRHGTTRIYVGCDAFTPAAARTETSTGHVTVTRTVTIGDHGTLLVAVCSNPSTGFRWTWPTWTHSVFKYVARSYVEPATAMPGAAGKDLFRFVARHAGNGRIVLTYSQPWAGGQKNAWALILNVRALTAKPVPPVPSVPAVNSVSMTCDEFPTAQDASGHATVERSVTARGSVTVTLCSNASTGFSWEQPTFDATALELTSHTTAPAASGPIGAAGTETWTFKVLKSVDSTVTFQYSQPWDGGTKDVWTLTLTVHAA